MKIWIGADWDNKKCVVEAELDGQRVRGKVERSPKGVEGFLQQLGPGQVIVGIEAGDPLWAGLWLRAGAEVFVFDAKKAKRFAESLSSSKASDDKRSAATLLEQVKSDTHRQQANQSVPKGLRGLERMVSLQDTVSGSMTRHTNQLRSQLRQIHPALEQELGDLDALSTLHLLRLAPTPAAWRELTEAEQREALRPLRGARRAKIQAVIGEEWTDFDATEERAARAHILHLVVLLETLVQQKKHTARELEAIIESNDDVSTARSVGGIGAFLGAGSVLALGEAADGRDTMALRMAVAPVTSRSGTRGDKCPKVHMRRSSKGLLKKIGYLIGVQLVARHAWAKAQYAYYRTKNIPGPGAYRRIARSFSRVLTAMLRDKADFDEARYVDGLKKHGVPWALALPSLNSA